MTIKMILILVLKKKTQLDRLVEFKPNMTAVAEGRKQDNKRRQMAPYTKPDISKMRARR